MIDYDKLEDRFEQIQTRAYSNNIGTNEEQLEVRTEIIKLVKEQVENLNIDDVSKNEAVCNCENEYWKEDESGDWYCTIHDKQA